MNHKSLNWQPIILSALGFWLSASLVIDLVIMPSMYSSGMMSEPGFATAGYSMFWVFNRIEILCAALSVTGLLILYGQGEASDSKRNPAIILSIILLAIALVDTYGFTPHLSGMGMDLAWFETARSFPSNMIPMQLGYWILELLKLVGCGFILMSMSRATLENE
ncbi:DUF4149 domain-containing protein [Roseofilum casamattae]|uniref:DUF4149 domain-containing protein n=1 Tax=Roseofilum casamattae BLCC-M143 TaxID=3022442 RepID=A0ABT7BRH9_9CYAN|nr:DUF4149 domain-containing protein [Roseofilum casamattae]MDJ1181800.1 DUF4149 domain-containing protein [Roseofilum casamattae BLCC-M143]